MIPLLEEINYAKGVISVGSADGKEYTELRKLTNRGLYFEPQLELFKPLVERINKEKRSWEEVHCYQLALLDRNGTLPFWKSKTLTCSSFLQLNPDRPGLHQQTIHKEMTSVKAVTLDGFFADKKHDPSNYNLLIMDVQGVEMSVLKGAEITLRGIDIIISELSYFPIYLNSTLADDMNKFLGQLGFRMIKEIPETFYQTNALYVRKMFL